MKFTLKDYQRDAVHDALANLRKARRYWHNESDKSAFSLFAIVAIITALLSILFKSMIPESVSVKVGAEAVDNILNILASSMLAVTTFSLSIMVTAYGSATTNVTPRATRLVVEGLC